MSHTSIVVRHIGLQKKIALNMDKMWDFEIVADDKKRFRASKSLLWCRSGYFKSLFEDANVKHVDVDMSSSLVEGVLEYVVSGTVSHHQIEELLKVSTKVSSLLCSLHSLTSFSGRAQDC